MYSVNDTILYGTQGVCTVCEIVKKKFGENETDYYMLRPVFYKNSTILAPCHSDITKQKMRSLLSKDEILELKEKISNEPVLWVDDALERRKLFSSILHSFEFYCLQKVYTCINRNCYQKGKIFQVLTQDFLKSQRKFHLKRLQ